MLNISNLIFFSSTIVVNGGCFLDHVISARINQNLKRIFSNKKSFTSINYNSLIKEKHITMYYCSQRSESSFRTQIVGNTVTNMLLFVELLLDLAKYPAIVKYKCHENY